MSLGIRDGDVRDLPATGSLALRRLVPRWAMAWPALLWWAFFFVIPIGLLDSESRELLLNDGTSNPNAMLPEIPEYPVLAGAASSRGRIHPTKYRMMPTQPVNRPMPGLDRRVAPLPQRLNDEITAAYAKLGQDVAVAVRSSATAEDLPEASFAGQQETFLNVRGIDAVIEKVHEVFASLFNDRAIAYRVHQDFDHAQVALSAGIQRMVRSDIGASGVMFTLDTESGFDQVVFITSSYGLGETVVQGAVNPDEFYVYKPALDAGRPAILRRNRGGKAIKMVYSDTPGKLVETVEVPHAQRFAFSLSDADVEALARQALIIERHYGRPMDIEWGKDGDDGELYILQARPETVKSRAGQKER